jgi:hypothetical protein
MVIVRSQDRTAIVETGITAYEDKRDKIAGHFIIGESITYTITLGSYATKERALEVLDEIQDKIVNGVLKYDKDYWGDSVNKRYEPCIVFNMPLE